MFENRSNTIKCNQIKPNVKIFCWCRLNELDVAFDMDEVEMVKEAPWDDNDSDLDADIDSGASQDKREWRVAL